MISIITPCKNADRWIEECYHSIVNQTFKNWEWIVVDDHSDDDSWTVIHNIGQKDPRVKSLINKGSGIIQALETALDQVNGEFITRMDMDDLLPENRLQLMVDKLTKSHERMIITGLVKYFSDQTISPGYQAYEEWLNKINLERSQWKHIYRECIIASPNWMMRTEEMKAIGGFDRLEYPEDYDLVFQWYKHQFKIDVIPETTLHWREHPDRTSRTSDHYQQEAFFKLKIKRFIELDFQNGPLVIWGNNAKSKLTSSLLDESGISPIHQDLMDFKQIENLRSPQLLIAVYPEEKERKEIMAYLKSIGMTLGKNWWWL